MSDILYDNMSYYSLIYLITNVNIIVCGRYIYGLIKQAKAGSESYLLFGYPMLMYMLTQNDPTPYLTGELIRFHDWFKLVYAWTSRLDLTTIGVTLKLHIFHPTGMSQKIASEGRFTRGVDMLRFKIVVMFPNLWPKKTSLVSWHVGVFSDVSIWFLVFGNDQKNTWQSWYDRFRTQARQITDGQASTSGWSVVVPRCVEWHYDVLWYIV